MEVSPTAHETPLQTTSVESRFFTSIFGDSEYARQLAVDFVSAIDEKYDLNGRYRRAFWINPGYEWTPTQTGGARLFQLSQKLFLVALVVLDEKIASSAGKSIFDSGPLDGALEDVGSDGASETVPNLPRVPAARRRALLTVDPAAGNGASLSASQLSFPVSRSSTMARAFGVDVSLVATFAVQMELTAEQACMGRAELQEQLRQPLVEYVKQTASSVKTVQIEILSLSVSGGSYDCGSRRRSLAAGTAEFDMLLVFAEASAGTLNFDIQAFSSLPAIRSVSPVAVSNQVSTGPTRTNTNFWTTESASDQESSSMPMGVWIAIGGGASALILLVAGGVVWMRAKSRVDGLASNYNQEKDQSVQGDISFSGIDSLTRPGGGSSPLLRPGSRPSANSLVESPSKFSAEGETEPIRGTGLCDVMM